MDMKTRKKAPATNHHLVQPTSRTPLATDMATNLHLVPTSRRALLVMDMETKKRAPATNHHLVVSKSRRAPLVMDMEEQTTNHHLVPKSQVLKLTLLRSHQKGSVQTSTVLQQKLPAKTLIVRRKLSP